MKRKMKKKRINNNNMIGRDQHVEHGRRHQSARRGRRGRRGQRLQRGQRLWRGRRLQSARRLGPGRRHGQGVAAGVGCLVGAVVNHLWCAPLHREQILGCQLANGARAVGDVPVLDIAILLDAVLMVHMPARQSTSHHLLRLSKELLAACAFVLRSHVATQRGACNWAKLQLCQKDLAALPLMMACTHAQH